MTGFVDLLAAEWLKLRTTRLLLGTIPAAVLLSSAAVAGEILSADEATLGTARSLRRIFAVTGTGAVVVLVVGILISAGEYRHGTAADTFLTTPRRQRVVVAKLAIGAAVGLATGLLAGSICLTTAGALYRARDVTFPFDDAEVWLALAGALVYTALFAVLGIGLGSLIRNQVLAVAVALAWLAVVEHTLVGLVPDVGRWLPLAAGEAMVRAPLEDLLSPLAGTAVLAAYAVVLSAVGLRAEATRDV